MDEFLEFLNKWLVRPVSILTALSTVLGFIYFAVALVLKAELTFVGADLAFDLSQIPALNLEVTIPAWDQIWRLENRLALLAAPAVFVLLRRGRPRSRRLLMV